MIQGYHVYKDIVMPTIRKILQSGREPDNSYDSFGVVIIENYRIGQKFGGRKVWRKCVKYQFGE